MLSTGQVTDAFQQGAGRAPTGQELSQYTSDNSLDGSSGQQSLVAKLGGGSGGLAAPGNAGDTQQYLNDYHNLVLQATAQAEKPMESDQQIMSDVKGALLPNAPVPQAQNMTQTFASLRSDPSVTNLETKLQQLKDQENTIKTQTMASQASENGKPVAMNVIQGRQTEEQSNADIQLSSIALQKAAVTDELTMRYTMIDNIMKFTQQDYDNSMKTYEAQFSQNQAVYTAFTQAKDTQVTQHDQALSMAISGTGTEVDQAQKEEALAYQQQQDTIRNASSNLTIMANMITNGNMKYSELSSDQKLQIQKLEVQAGLGTGFVENLTTNNPGGKVIYAGANGAVLQMPDGSLHAENYNVSGKGSGGSGDGTITPGEQRANLQQATADMTALLKGEASKGNNQGHIPPYAWQQAIDAWNAKGLKTSDFQKNFQHFADPNRGDFEASYGFKNYQSKKSNNSISSLGK